MIERAWLGHEEREVGRLRMLAEGWRIPALQMDRLPVEVSQSIEAEAEARYRGPE
jgi:hypothetical protein